MNIKTARRAAYTFVRDNLSEHLFIGEQDRIARALATVIRREAIAYHRRALAAARSRGRKA